MSEEPHVSGFTLEEALQGRWEAHLDYKERLEGHVIWCSHLQVALRLLVEKRRALAKILNASIDCHHFRIGKTHLETFVEIQNAVEAIDHAREEEERSLAEHRERSLKNAIEWDREVDRLRAMQQPAKSS